MRPTLNELMRNIGCQMWPERWQVIYDDAMDEFERRGCCVADPDYIDAIAERYQILENQRALYKEAALSVATQEPLARLLALLCAVLTDKEHREDDLGQFALAFSAEEKTNVGQNMLPGLALLSQMPECYDTLCGLGLPEEYILQTMRQPEGTVGAFRKMYGGVPGFHLLHWFQRLIRGGLFRVGRLQIEPCATFSGRAQVFQNQKGELLALGHERPTHASGIALGSAGAEATEGSWEANVEETELYWEGYPYDARGLVLSEKIRLEKGEWEKVLERNDPVVALHIPADGPLTPESVEDSLRKIREFMRTYFPEHPYKAFTCNSWLVNPEIALMLGEDSNIGKFCRLFRPLTKKAPGTSVFSFVYHKNGPVPLEELPEDTRLERALKAYYQSGKMLYEMYGFILRDPHR